MAELTRYKEIMAAVQSAIKGKRHYVVITNKPAGMRLVTILATAIVLANQDGKCDWAGPLTFSHQGKSYTVCLLLVPKDVLDEQGFDFFCRLGGVKRSKEQDLMSICEDADVEVMSALLAGFEQGSHTAVHDAN
jgi:hypothetical protein